MKRLIYLTLVSALLASCQMQEVEVGVPAPDIMATVETDPATKTQLSVDWEGTGVISWMPADKINVFFGNTGAQYTSQNTFNATTAVFSTSDSIGMEEMSSTNIWGLYPYNSNATCTGSAVTTTLPAAQAGVPETFDDDLYITLAHSISTSLQFFNVCSGLKFSLSRDDIKGNNNEDIAGDISLTFENSRPKATVTKGIKEITLTPKTGETFEKGANYYIVTLPVTLSKGFSITFTTIDGSVGTLNYTEKSVTLERAVFSRKSQLDTYASFSDIHEPVDLGLSVMWASCNVGASKPEEYGNYYAWGETSTKSDYSWTNYKFRVTGDSYSNVTFSKYNTKSDRGTVDNQTQLELSDDAARANWGGKWRMPTDAECSELRENCTWTWTTQNGVNGYKVTSNINGSSIFLPAAGYRTGSTLINAGSQGDYWSSTLLSDYPDFTYYVLFHSGNVSRLNCGRDGGLSVRPVYGDSAEVSVTGVSLNKASMSMTVGDTQTLTATVTPSNATNKSVTWSSNNTSVATVSSSGVVTAKAAGSTTITVTTNDGGKKATCSVTVIQSNSHEWVDLGLPSGLKWATCNVGASTPEGYGDYFAWGETEPKSDYSWKTYKWCNGSSTSLTKYNTRTGYGMVDNKIQLDPDDDAARVNWGGKWRMPTDSEWTELRNNCTWTWTTQNGVYGHKVTSRVNGNSIFLPAAGRRSGASLDNAGSIGRYWSSALYTGYPGDAYSVDFHSSGVGRGYRSRDYGQSVRPVTD